VHDTLQTIPCPSMAAWQHEKLPARMQHCKCHPPDWQRMQQGATTGPCQAARLLPSVAAPLLYCTEGAAPLLYCTEGEAPLSKLPRRQ
jgi:hypothetical protein